MKMIYEVASNTPLHVNEIDGNEESTLLDYSLRVDNTIVGMRFNLLNQGWNGIAIGSGLTIDIVPVGRDRLRVVTRRSTEVVPVPKKDLPTRATVVKQLLDAGLTPAEASEAASVEVEIGMARNE